VITFGCTKELFKSCLQHGGTCAKAGHSGLVMKDFLIRDWSDYLTIHRTTVATGDPNDHVEIAMRRLQELVPIGARAMAVIVAGMEWESGPSFYEGVRITSPHPAQAQEAIQNLRAQTMAQPIFQTAAASAQFISKDPKLMSYYVDPSLCRQCNKIAKSLCEKCLVAKYCDRDCQREHWAVHKQHCKFLDKSIL
jgi:hypothetical protein